MQRTNKWLVPAFCLVMGVVLFAASWAGGNPVAGGAMMGIMVAYGVVLLAGGRSETLRTMRGEPTDERWRMFDLRATAISGGVVVLILTGGFVYELFRGQDGNPYSLIMAVGGITYIVSLLVLRVRS